MWCNFRASSGAEEETMVNGFSTSALFKISSDEVASIFCFAKNVLSYMSFSVFVFDSV